MEYNPILVIGSINLDLVFTTDRCPTKGETVFGKEFLQIPGGKGANQAMAVGKLGGKVGFIGACGNDHYGSIVKSNLQKGGVDITGMMILEDHTGLAAIIVEGDGDNRIIVSQGANGLVTPEMINQLADKIESAEILLLQMEIPVEAVKQAIKIAIRSNTTVIFDPAPACELPDNFYEGIDYLLPNEGELDILLQRYKLSAERAKAKKLLELGVKNVIVTRGEKGVNIYNNEMEKSYDAFMVKTLDTTAAGDAFAGAMAFALYNKWEQEKIIEFAMKVAAFSVTRKGAQSSMPSMDDLEGFSRKLTK